MVLSYLVAQYNPEQFLCYHVSWILQPWIVSYCKLRKELQELLGILPVYAGTPNITDKQRTVTTFLSLVNATRMPSFRASKSKLGISVKTFKSRFIFIRSDNVIFLLSVKIFLAK